MVDYIEKCSVIVLLIISAVKCENCVTYDFGESFYDTFNHGNDICEGMAEWRVGNYSEIGIASPHPNTNSFITPSDVLSCVTSYTFEMRSAGILEVHVFMQSVSDRDQIVVLANEKRSTKKNAVTGTSMLTPLSVNYVNGWHILRINLVGHGNFEGYITLLGVASPGSKVIIDSFRYIPPNYENNCYLYDEDFVPATAPPSILPDPANCVIHDFEEQFDELFNTGRGLCTDFSAWNIEDYDSISIERPTPESRRFIAPNAFVSCISSRPYKFQAGGTVEVNVFMKSKSDSDQIAVLVNQMLDEHSDSVTGSITLLPVLPNFVEGWQVLRVQLAGDTAYDGYISFLGIASEESIVLIDSFRYVPPRVSKDDCNIYEEELFPVTTPVPITTPTPLGKECVSCNFEDNFDETFDMSSQLCDGYSSWNLGTYKSLDIETMFPESTTFISPNASASCVSSFIFEMKPEGIVEVNVFMKSVSETDYIIVLAKRLMENRVDTVAGFKLYYASNADFVEGWNTLTVKVRDIAAFNGYVALIGSMAEDSMVLIDSFRYTPPSYDGYCAIY